MDEELQHPTTLVEAAHAFLGTIEPIICPRCGGLLSPESVRVHANGNVRVYMEHIPRNGCTLSTMERQWTAPQRSSPPGQR